MMMEKERREREEKENVTSKCHVDRNVCRQANLFLVERERENRQEEE